MSKKLLPIFLCLFVLSACSATQSNAKSEETLTVVASTYPIYLLTEAVSIEAESVELSLLIEQELSCLHSYTMTVNEMKLLEHADVLIISGAGLDDFVLDALAGIPEEERPVVVNCSDYVDLLPLTDANGTVLEGSFDPHYWMSPLQAAQAAQGISIELSTVDPTNINNYRLDSRDAIKKLETFQTTMLSVLEEISCRKLITFHNGFAYFAGSFDLEILMAVEEEEGQEASAQVIAKALSLIEEHQLPAIFTEVNSSDATAQAIGREAGIDVVPLSTLMSDDFSGDARGIEAYIAIMLENVQSLYISLG